VGGQLLLLAHIYLGGLKMKKTVANLLMVLFTMGFIAAGATVARADNQGLGIAIQVTQGANDSSKDLNKNNKLWFVISPGKSGTRDFEIRSASDIPQIINLGIGGQKQVNGVLEYDPAATTPVAKWATFTKNDFLLAPRATVTVSMTISVPDGTSIQTYQPSLLVRANAVRSSSAQYKVPTALQFSQEIFLGVGTSDQFLTRFSIDDVNGVNGNSGHMLVVNFSNTGKTPVALTGDLQLTNLTFAGVTIGPLKFISSTIAPGGNTQVYVPVDERVTEDKWRILVRAQQGSIEETKSFDKDISFKGTNFIQVAQFSGLIVLVSALLLIIAIRTLRSIKRKQLEEQRIKDEAEAERIAEAARVAELERQLAEMQAALAKPKPKRKPTTKAKAKPKAD
jgi:hypothetical protein